MTDTNSNKLSINRKILARIFSKIKVSKILFYKGTPCWEWQGFINPGGYAITRHSKTAQRSAHRIIYQMFVEPIPHELQCDHLCRVRHCVNPIHIEPVTPKENVGRSMAPAGINARKTCCIRGHKFTPDNIKTWGDNRVCIACIKIQQRKTYLKRTPEQIQRRREYSLKRQRDIRNEIRALPADHPRKIAYKEQRRNHYMSRKKRLKKSLD